jgi:lipopolysaccharide export system permease protein
MFGTLTIMGLFLVQYMMREIDKLAGKGLDAIVILEFMALTLSWIVVLAVPLGTLFGCLMAFGNLSSSHEVTIFKASGMGLFRMMIPIIIIGALLWGGVFWYTDTVLPETNHRLSSLMRDIQRVKPTFAVEAGQFSTNLDGYTILARRTDTSGTLYGVTIYDRSKPERTIIVNADTARLGFTPELTQLIMQLYHGEIHQRNERRPADYRVITFVRHQMVMQADRFFFESSDPSGSSRGEREMSIADMQGIVDRSTAQLDTATIRINTLISAFMTDLVGTSPLPRSLGRGLATTTDTLAARSRALARMGALHTSVESEGFRVKAERETVGRFLVEIHKKYSIPAACMLFVFVGCPLGILTKGGNFGISAAISLGFYVVNWASLIGGETLADRGFLHPGMAMWIGNTFLLITGIVVTIKVNYEMTILQALRSVFRR